VRNPINGHLARTTVTGRELNPKKGHRVAKGPRVLALHLISSGAINSAYWPEGINTETGPTMRELLREHGSNTASPGPVSPSATGLRPKKRAKGQGKNPKGSLWPENQSAQTRTVKYASPLEAKLPIHVLRGHCLEEVLVWFSTAKHNYFAGQSKHSISEKCPESGEAVLRGREPSPRYSSGHCTWGQLAGTDTDGLS